MVLTYNFYDVLTIAFGAAFGANTRYQIYKKLEQINVSKRFIILVINISSSFFLGLFLSILSDNSSLSYYDQLVLFFSIGLLGSLSTYSSFIYDLYELCIKFQFKRALKLFIISITLGMASFAVGFVLGMH